MPSQIATQRQAIEDLMGAFEELEKRLRPVMKSSPEINAKDGGGPSPVLVDIAAAIAENTSSLRGIRQSLVEILDRLEV